MTTNDPMMEPLKQLFITAAQVDRMLPPADRRLLKSFWPDIKQTEWLAYGKEWTEIRLQASAQQISLYQLAIDLSVGLPDDDDRKLLWGCAFSAVNYRGQQRYRGIAWTRVAKQVGLHRHTVERRFYGILRKIAVSHHFSFG